MPSQAPTGLSPEQVAQIKAQMVDIIEPAAIGLWPLAWGWWLLIISLFIAITVVIFFAIKHYRHNRYRRQALIALQNIQNNTSSNAQLQAQELMQLCKQVCLHAYPKQRSAIAQTHGAVWLNWLNTTTQISLFNGDDATQWQLALYAPNAQKEPINPDLFAIVQRWIKYHINTHTFNKKALNHV